MDILLSKVTQQAMNHAIRCGITITSGYAIRQCSRLIRTVKENAAETSEITTLQQRLEAKIRIISPAIDMIELIAARGNTSLESAVTLTKQIRWDIQSLGVRLAKAAAAEEAQRRGSSRARTKAQTLHELKLIIADMRRLLERIEDAVPLINLAITTSGVNLSTTLPSSVSPSRLLQASTFLTSGDSRYAMSPGQPVQVGPVFTLSMYMLFSAHAFRPHDDNATRETTWKEVIHKARIKLLRVPLSGIHNIPVAEKGWITGSGTQFQPKRQSPDTEDVPSEGKAFEFAYQLLIIEDLDDDRVHTFEDDETQPGPVDDVALAGIREVLPIHEISKIFYADTGKILNIGTDGEVNNPVLLLKRDPNAVPPRRMMGQEASERLWYESDDDLEGHSEIPSSLADEGGGTDDRPGTPSITAELGGGISPPESEPWSLPPNLDPEWIAFEVYNEPLDSEDEEDVIEDASTSPPRVPGSAGNPRRSGSLDPTVSEAFSDLRLGAATPPSSQRPQPATQLVKQHPLDAPATLHPWPTQPTSLPALRTSLSLLELLIRLTALQQFQQMSHLAINDELLNFFLHEAGTTGAGGDPETRQRVRREARERVGFDPYDESPIKRRGEEYLEQHAEGSRYADTEGLHSTPHSEQHSPHISNEYDAASNAPGRLPLHLAARKAGPRQAEASQSPITPSPLAHKSRMRHGPLESGNERRTRSPLLKNESDSTLGTSPGNDVA